MVIYNPKKMMVNKTQLTKHESLILNEIISREIVSFENLNEATGSLSTTRASTVTVARLKKKIKGLFEIRNRRGIGYYIPDKSNIRIKEGSLLRPIEFEEYNLNLHDLIIKLFEDYKEEINDAEEKFKERLEKVLKWEIEKKE